MNLSKFVEYVKVHATWKNKPDKSTPIDASALMKIESGIKANNEAINELAAAVVSQIANDPNKIASLAALYAVNAKVGDTTRLPGGAKDVTSAIITQNSDLDNKISILASDPAVTARFVTEQSTCSLIINHTSNKIMQITFDIANARLTASYFNGSAWSNQYVIKQW